MIKVIGAMLVIAGTTLYGLFLNAIMSQRIKQLTDYRDTLMLMSGYIDSGSLGMEELCRSIAKNSRYDYVRKFYGYLAESLAQRSGREFSEIWRSGVRLYCEETFLGREEGGVLDEAGDLPLYLDGEAQTRFINEVIAKINARIHILQSEAAQKSRIYKYVGFAAGVFLVLILI